jgi:MazG family protein
MSPTGGYFEYWQEGGNGQRKKFFRSHLQVKLAWWGMMQDETDALTRLRAVVHRLRAPGGCPWDREQTHESLIPHVLEEAYEVADAIRGGDPALMCEELGDLLLQAVLHAEIASETGAFDLDRMAEVLTEKLIRRHPHVFGESSAETSAAVLEQWDAIKRVEKGHQNEGYLHGVGSGLPGLMRAQKLQKKAARVGFDWPEMGPVVGKVREELAEVEAALEAQDAAQVEEEIGDLLFSVVNLARKAGVQAEAVMAAANEKFMRRFHAMERRLTEAETSLDAASLEVMDAAWDEVKRLGS